MRRVYKVFASVLLGGLMFGSVAFAQINQTEAVNIVKAEYPNAVIHEVEYDSYESKYGCAVWEVEFSTPELRKVEFKINADTGEVIRRKIKNKW